jgi:hypothetical protein
MFEGRMAKIAALLEGSMDDSSLAQRICDVGKVLLSVEGMSLSIVVHRVLNSDVGTSKEYMFLDEQQFTFGQGPTFDASLSENPVEASNLDSYGDRNRWPIFAPIASSKGIHSITAYPLRSGNESLGVITAYRKSHLELSPSEYVDGLTLGVVASNLLLMKLSGNMDPDLREILGPTMQDQSIIHLASGMVAEQLNITIIEAMVRIRAHAYKTDQPLSLVSNKIINRQLQLDAEEK